MNIIYRNNYILASINLVISWKHISDLSPPNQNLQGLDEWSHHEHFQNKEDHSAIGTNLTFNILEDVDKGALTHLHNALNTSAL